MKNFCRFLRIAYGIIIHVCFSTGLVNSINTCFLLEISQKTFSVFKSIEMQDRVSRHHYLSELFANPSPEMNVGYPKRTINHNKRENVPHSYLIAAKLIKNFPFCKSSSVEVVKVHCYPGDSGENKRYKVKSIAITHHRHVAIWLKTLQACINKGARRHIRVGGRYYE
uniref:Uncharacterized protein n=1 Tax=Glossina brevipalpis TaxID=37001 RepID=A0A1A9VZA1_9MUSC